MGQNSEFELVLISAWNQSGGALLHRLFDGHPQLFVYPFELQLGTTEVKDQLTRWFHKKYRWPQLRVRLGKLSVEDIRGAFLDEELKEYLHSRINSKFRDFDLDFSDEDARACFEQTITELGFNRRGAIIAYVRSIFTGWKNRVISGQERMYLGHCPIIIVEADQIYHDFPDAHILHVVRNPFSGFVDTRRRIPTMTVQRYCQRWTYVNFLGYHYRAKYPKRCHLVHYENLVADREPLMRELCSTLHTVYDGIVLQPTWNGHPIEVLSPPFGGIPDVTREYNDRCIEELTRAEREAIRSETGCLLQLIGYDEFPS